MKNLKDMLDLSAKKLFVFDMDGLMLDTESTYYQAWKKLLEVDGHKLQFEFYKTLIGSPDYMVKDKFLAEYGPDFPFDYYVRQYKVESYAMMGKTGVSVKPGLISLLDLLVQKGISRAVATSSPRIDMEKLLKGSKVYPYFHHFLCGDEIRYGKPHPEIYKKILTMSGCLPEEAVVLEDSINGIRAAAAAGIDCIFVKDIVDPGSEVLALTCASLESLEEVALMLI